MTFGFLNFPYSSFILKVYLTSELFPWASQIQSDGKINVAEKTAAAVATSFATLRKKVEKWKPVLKRKELQDGSSQNIKH